MNWKPVIALGALIGALMAPSQGVAQQVRATALLGAAVDRTGGETIGHVTDLAIDLASGEVRYAMVYANGSADLAEQVYGVPLSALRPGMRRDHLVLDPAAASAPAPQTTDAQLVRVSRLIGGDLADIVIDLDSAAVEYALVKGPAGATHAAPLAALDPAIELRGVILERSLVPTRDGVRQTARLKTPEGRVITLDFGPPGGEATIAPGEAVTVAAHPGKLQGKAVLVVDIILQRQRGIAR